MTDSFENVLRQLQNQLSAAETQTRGDGSETAAAAASEVPEVATTVESADERVKVTMTGNAFTALTLDPRALRQTNAELADQLLEVLNAVLTRHSTALAAAMAEQNPTDLSALKGEVEKLQTESIDAMRSYTSSLFAALDQARRLNNP